LAAAIYQPSLDAEVLCQLGAGSRGPLDHEAMTRLFERIIDEAGGSSVLRRRMGAEGVIGRQLEHCTDRILCPRL